MSNETPYYRRHSLFGPLLLVGIGVLFLLRNMGVLSYHNWGWWFSRYWPALLILWGVTRLLEHLWAREKGYPAPRIGAGGVVFLVFFIMLGVAASASRDVDWHGLGVEFNLVDFFDIFDSHYEFSDEVVQAIEPDKQVKITLGHGDLNVTLSPDDRAHVAVHKVLRSGSENEAKQMNEATHPKFEKQGDVWVLDLSSGNFERGQFNLDVQLPKTIPVSLMTGHGDIHVSVRGANVDLQSSHGDLTAEDIQGDARLQLRHGDATVKNVTGNVTVDGVVSDTRISNVSGTLALTGTYTGDTQLSHIAKQVSFRSTRTDLQIAGLEGDLNMEPDSLRAHSVAGPFRLVTSSKDVRVEDLKGDVHVEDRHALVELHMKSPFGSVDVGNSRGQITIGMPDNAGFQVDAESTNGNIQSDFNLDVNNNRRDVTARGTVGKGGPQLHLRTERGTIQIHKE
jgi:DUF4097 and DUF4098 domain-containing protein YvlB